MSLVKGYQNKQTEKAEALFMPSLTRCSVQAVKVSERLVVSTASARRLLQSSASCKKSDAHSRSSSRTRLTRDLTPRSNSGRIVVAPKRFDSPSDVDIVASKNFKQWAQSTVSKIRTSVPVFNELYNPPSPVTFASTNANPKVPSPLSLLPIKFISPPLMPGFVTSLAPLLGDNAKPTPIQALSIRWLIERNKQDPSGSTERWKQFLLASETGSGKSIAYLLPVLQHLKESELQGKAVAVKSDLDLNPRALILAPTHELSRQLSKFAKKLSHGVKLRVLCASQANVKNTREKDTSFKSIRSQLDQMMLGTSSSTENVEAMKTDIPVDVVVGTPMKLLDMVRGRGWNKEEADIEDEIQTKTSRRPFEFTKGKPQMGLANVQWVVVDEADVLFDPDFQEYTRMLLADISAARGVPVVYSPECSLSASEITRAENSKVIDSSDVQPLNYPFNLILTTATIPSALVSYLDKHHPNLTRLVSPNLHHLPKALRTEHVAWSGGNRFADIEGRIRRVWADDSVAVTTPGALSLSKVLIFCNKSIKVTELGEYLAQKGIKNIALTSTSEERKHGSNKHLEGFLRPFSASEKQEQKKVKKAIPSIQDEPHVMITTSLLSRGLDFSPEIKHVFIVDQPRNMIDFLHRAGRSGRAGEKGKVVIFGKMKGRGSAQAKEARKRVGALVA